MAELRLVTWSGELVTPQDDALLYEEALQGNIIIYGCEITRKDADNLHIAEGFGVISGRFFEVSDSDIRVTRPTSGSATKYVKLQLDLSNVDKPLDIILSDSSSTREDANVNIVNGITEMLLATITVDSGSGIGSSVVPYDNSVSPLLRREDLVSGFNTRIRAGETAVDGYELNENQPYTIAGRLRGYYEKFEDLDILLDELLSVESYSYTYQISANSRTNITANNFGVTLRQGYKPVAVIYFNTGAQNVFALRVDASATGTGQMMALKNTAGSDASYTAHIAILFAKSDIVGGAL